MRRILCYTGKFLALCLMISFSSGCAVKFQEHHSQDIKRIEELNRELGEMNSTMKMLEEKLKEEIKSGDVSVEKKNKGIVVTFVAEILFDSGKAKVKTEGLNILKKTASVLKDVDNEISIEGHTDNVPIKYSGWKSNWELSTARALSVLHFLVETEGLDPDKLSATGYGEYKPIASNETADGKQKNRRVEIVIKPRVDKAAEEETETKIK